MPDKKPDCKQKQSKRTYVKLPIAIIGDDKLTFKQFRVYAALCHFADNKTGFCYPSNEQIHEITGIHIRDIRRATNELCAHGWIEKTVIKSRKYANEYRVLPEKTGTKKVLELVPARGGETPLQEKSGMEGRNAPGSNRPPQLRPYLHQGKDYLHQEVEVSIPTIITRGVVH